MESVKVLKLVNAFTGIQVYHATFQWVFHLVIEVLPINLMFANVMKAGKEEYVTDQSVILIVEIMVIALSLKFVNVILAGNQAKFIHLDAI